MYFGDYKGTLDDINQELKLVSKSTTKQSPNTLRVAYFCRGIAQELLGNHQDAIKDYKKCMELASNANPDSIYAPIFSYFAYMEIGDTKSAQVMLHECVLNSDHALWPYPAIEYLLGEKTAPELESAATDNGKMTEAKTYIGLNLLLQGNRDSGLSYLKWVQEHGAKDFYEYKLATAALSNPIHTTLPLLHKK
jgi:tetratricopeptide (TPR) repeat protein